MEIRHGGNIYSAGVGWREVLDFSASINPLGPSPKVREAIINSLDRIPHYPEPTGAALREALAKEWQVPANKILLGNGATDLLFAWCRHVGTGTLAAPVFSEFHRAWPNAAICKLTDRPTHGPVVFTRPANPTGCLPEIRDYVTQHSAPVLVDESFIDFTDAPSLVPEASGNLFVLRSLTKFWALPGLRVGALVGDIERIATAQPPWMLNVLAEAAGLASLADPDHFERSRAFVRSEGAWLAQQLGVVAPTANYLYVEHAGATDFVRFAAERHILVRDCTDWPGLPASAFRVAVRTRPENEKLLQTFKEFSCA